jgi:hypothetical protein
LHNQSIAWHPLGYIYDLSIDKTASLHNAQTSLLKYQRLQAIFKVILETSIDAQAPNALDGIEVTLGGITKTVNIHAPDYFIIGDMQGGIRHVLVCSATSTKCSGYATNLM